MKPVSLRRLLYQVYWAMESRIAPGLKYAQFHYEAALNGLVQAGVAWLDIGCGHQLLPPWRASAERDLASRPRRLVGLDADLGALNQNAALKQRVCGDVTVLPFRDRSFDLVTANMVVEHLTDPVPQFREVARVLKPGGRFVFHTPNLRSYQTLVTRLVPEGLKSAALWLAEGRPADDHFRAFYRANTEVAIRRVASATGLRVASIECVCTTAMVVVVPPVAALELLWLRVLQGPRMANFRPNIIATLVKDPGCQQPSSQ